MNCPKCGTILQPNVKFCKRCGASISQKTSLNSNSTLDHDQQYNYSYNYSNKEKPDYNTNASHADQYDYNYLYSKFNYVGTQTAGDERYIESYIGPNYSTIKSGRFSISAFIFGGFYMLYRKMYSYAFLYFALIIASNILLDGFSDAVNIAINIIMAFKFNTSYLAHVERKVEQIKQSNFDKTSTELLEECRKKGGVSLNAAVLIPIIIIVITTIVFLYFGYTTIVDLPSNEQYEEQTTNTNQYNNEETDQTQISTANSFHSLTYTVPDNTRVTSEGRTYKYYLYEESDPKITCYIRITTMDGNYITAEESLTNKISNSRYTQVSSIKQVTKNNHNWYYVDLESQLESKTYYATNYNDKIYTIEKADYTSTQTKCSEVYTEFIDSVKFSD